MPELEYLILADYVRQDAGTAHIMGAGIDTISVPRGALPAAPVMGLFARITFSSRDEVGAGHQLTFTLEGPDGDLLSASQQFKTPPQLPGVPEHWRTALNIVARIPLPLPHYGDYQLRATLDEDTFHSKSLDIRAVELQQPAGQT